MLVLAIKIILLATLVIAMPAALFVLGRKTWSLYSQRSTRRRLAEGMAKAREGDIPGAVRLLLKAERSWSLNSYDGSRDSLLRDLDEYVKIAGGIFSVLHINAGPVYQDINGLVGEMRRHLADRSNFGVDGRRMKPDAAVRWAVMCRRLDEIRPKLRSTCDPRMPGGRAVSR